MIRQLIREMEPQMRNRSAFFQLQSSRTLADVSRDLKELEKQGYRYIFLDEVTLLEDFIEGAALFSDIFAASGMKILLSGTDPLGFLFTEDEELYDWCILCHTTFIPYREFERVLGIDDFIRYGGTMSLGGRNYNKEYSIFATKKGTDAYVDSVIARNIQHSLKHYRHEDHFRSLRQLYEKNELTNVINKIVEDMVLLETALPRRDCEVFRLQFAVGEFDMVIFDSASGSCEIFEIKHSRKAVPQQCRHLLDKEKCRQTAFRYGPIRRKAVIYRGETRIPDDSKEASLSECGGVSESSLVHRITDRQPNGKKYLHTASLLQKSVIFPRRTRFYMAN